VSCDKPYHVIGDKWNCSMVKDDIAVYCKEVFYLLADVVDTEDPSARSIFPRPGKGRRFAGYLYFRRCLIPLLMNKLNTDY
jgi:hypothetical protein